MAVIALGFLGSFLGANNLGSTSDVATGPSDLQTSSAEIAATLNLAIEHEQDLAISAGAFIVENPNASESSFIRWVDDVDAFQRYPEILAVAEVDIVRPSQLKAFAARADINEKESKAPSQTFTLTPPGKRPFYCLVDVEHARAGLTEIPIGLDLCDSSLGPQLLRLATRSDRPTPPTAWAVRPPLRWARRSIATAATRPPRGPTSRPHRFYRHRNPDQHDPVDGPPGSPEGRRGVQLQARR